MRVRVGCGAGKPEENHGSGGKGSRTVEFADEYLQAARRNALRKTGATGIGGSRNQKRAAGLALAVKIERPERLGPR